MFIYNPINTYVRVNTDLILWIFNILCASFIMLFTVSIVIAITYFVMIVSILLLNLLAIYLMLLMILTIVIDEIIFSYVMLKLFLIFFYSSFVYSRIDFDIGIYILIWHLRKYFVIFSIHICIPIPILIYIYFIFTFIFG